MSHWDTLPYDIQRTIIDTSQILCGFDNIIYNYEITMRNPAVWKNNRKAVQKLGRTYRLKATMSNYAILKMLPDNALFNSEGCCTSDGISAAIATSFDIMGMIREHEEQKELVSALLFDFVGRHVFLKTHDEIKTVMNNRQNARRS